MNRTAAVQDNVASSSSSDSERIGILEERSKHAATTAQLYKVAFSIIVVLGGLIVHLHNQQVALIEKLAGG